MKKAKKFEQSETTAQWQEVAEALGIQTLRPLYVEDMARIFQLSEWSVRTYAQRGCVTGAIPQPAGKQPKYWWRPNDVFAHLMGR